MKWSGLKKEAFRFFEKFKMPFLFIILLLWDYIAAFKSKADKNKAAYMILLWLRAQISSRLHDSFQSGKRQPGLKFLPCNRFMSFIRVLYSAQAEFSFQLSGLNLAQADILFSMEYTISLFLIDLHMHEN